MKAVIVEDEFIAAQSLKRLLKISKQSINIAAVLQSVEESVEWFLLNPHPDVVFMDIHLADGDSFSIFEQVKISCPIIFTTAYDEYALKAFEVNSLDYLLKPINQKKLDRALEKLVNFTLPQDYSESINKILETIQQTKNPHKKHFLIPYRDKLIPLKTSDIAYIVSEYKMAKIITFNNQTYLLDTSLDELGRQLDPADFFRANRQYIVAHKAIQDMSVWFGGKLSVNLFVPASERILVSRARNNEFKAWFLNEME